MSAAGNGSNIANKYKAKGLRVIAIDIDGNSKEGSQTKWRQAGANFYLYDKDMNCFKSFYASAGGYPYNAAIKEWVGKSISDSEDAVKTAFGF